MSSEPTPTPTPTPATDPPVKRTVPAKRKAPSGEEVKTEDSGPGKTGTDPSAKAIFAKRRRVNPPEEAKAEPTLSEPTKDAPPLETPTPPIPKVDPPVQTAGPSPSRTEPTAGDTPTPNLRRSTVLDMTAKPVEELVPASAPVEKDTKGKGEKKGWLKDSLPYDTLRDDYAALLIGCMDLTCQPEQMTVEQMDAIFESVGTRAVWTLARQNRMRPPMPSLQRSFGFMWYRPHREGPKVIDRLSVVSPDCAGRVLLRTQTEPVDVQHANAMVLPFVEAWWRTHAQAKAGGTLVEPICVILGGEITGHFTTLISRDGIYYKHHNSLPMGSADGRTKDSSDLLAEKFVRAARQVIADLSFGDEQVRAHLRSLNIPYVTQMMEDRNKGALRHFFDNTEFYVVSHLDRVRVGPAQIQHQSLIQPAGSNECLLHCIERIAYCMADNANGVGLFGGPTLEERRAMIKRMRACCIKWYKMKWGET